MMPISGVNAGGVQPLAAAGKMLGASGVRKPEEEAQGRQLKPVMDEYVPEEPREPSGLYWMGVSVLIRRSSSSFFFFSFSISRSTLSVLPSQTSSPSFFPSGPSAQKGNGLTLAGAFRDTQSAFQDKSLEAGLSAR